MNSVSITTVLAAIVTQSAAAFEVQLQRFELPNGIRVVAVHAPEAPKQTIFTFLPLNLVNDDPHRAQWSHLLEHMVIRSTDPLGLAAGSIVFNGETTPTYLRFETLGPAAPPEAAPPEAAPPKVGPPDNWTQMLDRHAKWLNPAARSFDAETLEREKGNIAAEEQSTSAGGFTTKFALAAWNQIVRHEVGHAKVHGDVANALLNDVQTYAAQRLPVDESVMIATIGPIPLDQVRADLERVIGSLEKRKAKQQKAADVPLRSAPQSQPAGSPPEAGAPATAPQASIEFNGTWDLPTHHAMWFWELPDQAPATQAAAAGLARAIHVHLYTMIHIEWKDKVRGVMVYPFVKASDKAFFVIDFCLPAGADHTALNAGLRELIASFQTGQHRHGIPAMLAQVMANEISTTIDFDSLRRHLPQQLRDSAEGVWLLSLMNYEYDWGIPAEQVSKELRALDPVALKALLDRVNSDAFGFLALKPLEP